MLLPAIPATIGARCARPAAMPDRVLTQAEVETLWSHDRTALVRCGWSLDALTSFYTDLRDRLAAAAQHQD